jgi:hypothetical protein
MSQPALRMHQAGLKAKPMKAPHAIALALVGWYLFTPPISKSGDVLCNAPLANWEHENGGGTLAECKKNKQAAIRLMEMFSAGQ